MLFACNFLYIFMGIKKLLLHRGNCFNVFFLSFLHWAVLKPTIVFQMKTINRKVECKRNLHVMKAIYICTQKEWKKLFHRFLPCSLLWLLSAVPIFFFKIWATKNKSQFSKKIGTALKNHGSFSKIILLLVLFIFKDSF